MTREGLRRKCGLSSMVTLETRAEIEESKLTIMTSWMQDSCQRCSRQAGKTSSLKLEDSKLAVSHLAQEITRPAWTLATSVLSRLAKTT